MGFEVVSGSNKRAVMSADTPGPLSQTVITRSDGRLERCAASSNTPAAHLRSCDGVDRVAHKVEDDLLDLTTISAKRWKVILDYEINNNLCRRCLWFDERDNILQQAADVNIIHERPAMQKLAGAPHNIAGRVDLADERREIAVSSRQIRVGAAQDVLPCYRPSERPNRGDWLVNFMGERRCHSTWRMEASAEDASASYHLSRSSASWNARRACSRSLTMAPTDSAVAVRTNMSVWNSVKVEASKL